MELKKDIKITCTKFEGGDGQDLVRAKRFLKIGNEYTIDRFYISGRATDVFFKEIPNISFNSLYFE